MKTKLQEFQELWLKMDGKERLCTLLWIKKNYGENLKNIILKVKADFDKHCGGCE